MQTTDSRLLIIDNYHQLEDWASSLAKIHSESIPYSLNAFCGEKHLIDCYKCLLKNKLGQIAILVHDKTLLGGVILTKNLSSYKKAVLLSVVIKHPIRTMIGILLYLINTSFKFKSDISYSMIPNSPWLIAVFISKHCRNKGYGKNLVFAADNYFAKLGITDYYLETKSDNKAARIFYEKNGYKTIFTNSSLVIFKKIIESRLYVE